MRYFREETSVDYAAYHFGYTFWGIPESEADIESLYDQGYLPYSGSEKPLPVYYLCRSLRVLSDVFVLSSENRRILRKVSEAGISPDVLKYSGYETANDDLLIDFFLGYFSRHHGDDVMTKDRLLSVLRYAPHVWVTAYMHEGKLLGAVISQEVGDTVHYWFSAYTDAFPGLSLGMWLMVSFITTCADLGRQRRVYLGTGYGQKALYKANIEQIEYFDGNQWKSDLKSLKNLLKNS